MHTLSIYFSLDTHSLFSQLGCHDVAWSSCLQLMYTGVDHTLCLQLGYGDVAYVLCLQLGCTSRRVLHVLAEEIERRASKVLDPKDAARAAS